MEETVKTSGREFHTAWHDGALGFANELLQERYGQAHISKKIYRPSALVCFFAEPDGEQRVLKIEPRRDRDRALTVWAVEQWRRAGVLMPKLITSEVTAEFEFEISEYASGQPFTDDTPWEHKEQAIGDMVSQLSLIHSVETTGFGLLQGEGKGQCDTWREDLSKRSAARWHDGADCYSDGEKKFLDGLLDEIDYLAVTSVLLHGDFKLYNAFLDGSGHVRAIIDPNVMCGDPLWDVATWRHFVTRRAIRASMGVGPKQEPEEFERERVLFLELYEQKRGRGLTEEEERRVAVYELISLAKKVPKLLKAPYWKTEGDAVLLRVREEIARWS